MQCAETYELKSYNARKWVVFAAAAILIIIAVAAAMIIKANAAPSFDVKEWLFGSLTDMSGLFKYGMQPYVLVHEIFTWDIFDTCLFGSGSPAHCILVPVKVVAGVIFFINAIVQMVIMIQRDEGSIEGWLKIFIVTMLTFVAITSTDKIISAVDEIGTNFSNTASQMVQSSTDSICANYGTVSMNKLVEDCAELVNDNDTYTSLSEALIGKASDFITLFCDSANAIGNSSITDLLTNVAEVIGSGVVSTVLPGIGVSLLGYSAISATTSLIEKLVVYIVLMAMVCSMSAQCVALVFEKALRQAFMPIAVADIGAEGLRSSGMRYIKSYLGIYVRVVMFYVIGAMGQILIAWASNGITVASEIGSIGLVIVVSMACKAAMKGTGQLSKEIVGG